MTTLLNETSLAPAGDAPPGKRVQHREEVETAILREAVRLFAERGFEGTPIADVAERAGLSKQNLMYYFPTKQSLYKRVLDDVLDDWLARMASLADPDQDPADVLRAYVAAKLRFSREQPLASRVYAMEVIGGAKMYGEQIRDRVVPLLRQDIAVNATHLLFAVWAMTQSYADFSAQMALVLGRDALTAQDFEEAERVITAMVLSLTTQGAKHA
jgi:TetR/AcrR family transcriptional regulator